MIDGRYHVSLDTRPGHAKCELWRAGIKLTPREGLAVLDEGRELLIDMLDAAPRDGRAA